MAELLEGGVAARALRYALISVVPASLNYTTSLSALRGRPGRAPRRAPRGAGRLPRGPPGRRHRSGRCWTRSGADSRRASTTTSKCPRGSAPCSRAYADSTAGSKHAVASDGLADPALALCGRRRRLALATTRTASTPPGGHARRPESPPGRPRTRPSPIDCGTELAARGVSSRTRATASAGGDRRRPLVADRPPRRQRSRPRAEREVEAAVGAAAAVPARSSGGGQAGSGGHRCWGGQALAGAVRRAVAA